MSKISINPQILFDYIYIGIQHHTESTFFNDVQILRPGHNLVYNLDSNCYTISKYYDIAVNKEIYDLSLQDSVDLYREELKKSLCFHLRSDVTVGTCLSGGLDSSVIAAMVSNEYRKQSKLKFKAITAKSIDPETDESRYAAKIVNSFDLDWHVTQPTLADLYDSIDTTIKIQEEPFLGLSIAMQYFVMKEARQAGCTVLLDGQGGDETLLGNVRYYATSLKGLNTRQLINSYIAIARNSELSLVDILAYKMYFTNLRVRNLYIKRRSNFVKKDYRQYYNRELITEITKSYQCLETLQHWEVTRAQLPKLLQYEDKNSMHFSIEARVPYLDHQLVETALSISPFHRIHKGWTKYPLREIAREILPPEIAWRKHKFGFEAPQSAWINKYRQDMMPVIRNSDLVNGFANLKKLESFDMDSLWKLYNLAKWAELFEVNSEF